MSRRRRATLFSRMRELTLPRAERRAARSERLAERQMRRERDNTETAARRAAAMQAESQSRHSGGFSQHWRD
jgi:hypothetical protein